MCAVVPPPCPRPLTARLQVSICTAWRANATRRLMRGPAPPRTTHRFGPDASLHAKHASSTGEHPTAPTRDGLTCPRPSQPRVKRCHERHFMPHSRCYRTRTACECPLRRANTAHTMLLDRMALTVQRGTPPPSLPHKQMGEKPLPPQGRRNSPLPPGGAGAPAAKLTVSMSFIY